MTDPTLRLELAKRFVALTREEMETAKRRWLSAMDELDLAQKAMHESKQHVEHVPV
jgi:hypothetical protein